MESGGSPVLSVNGVYKSRSGHQVLAGINLELRPGEILGLIGQNGVGKSTLAGIISGDLPADEGWMGMSNGDWDPEKVMLIDPNIELDPDLSVCRAMFRDAENELNIGEMMINARRVLAESGIPLLATDRLGDLSNSERRMVEVLRILANPKDVTIIDELSNTLNAREVEDLRYAIARCCEQGRGVIYITHRMDEAVNLCDRVVALREGRVAAEFDRSNMDPKDLTEAMFGKVIDIKARLSHVSDNVLMQAELNCTTGPVSFTLHAGEILSFYGARDSGIDAIRETITGRGQGHSGSFTVLGAPVQITEPADLPRHSIAVLTSLLDPEADSHTAWNLAMADGEVDDYEDTFANTLDILKALRASEEAAGRLFGRPVLSTGQRRWQQLQDLAAEHAKIMILIDPTDSLDPDAQERFVQLLNEVTGRGIGVLLFSGQESDIHRLSDRILVLAEGRIQAEWLPDKVSVDDLRAVSRGELAACA